MLTFTTATELTELLFYQESMSAALAKACSVCLVPVA